ncbi:MAG TPA: transposase [Pirellulaceae bacterium]|nr:transposase [Pirellulaceae bacterium]
MFVGYLEGLRRRLRRYRVIHMICDNAQFHDCRLVRHYLVQHPGRFQLHFLPKYAPEINPIERVWWRLHETITRNHRCTVLPQLLNEVHDYLETNEQLPRFRNAQRV